MLSLDQNVSEIRIVDKIVKASIDNQDIERHVIKCHSAKKKKKGEISKTLKGFCNEIRTLCKAFIRKTQFEETKVNTITMKLYRNSEELRT